MDWKTDNLRWTIVAVIALIGIAIGWRDLLRFRFRRLWAISDVSFAESIRRRVLWVTPLAMLGVIVVSQLSRPSDEIDVVRQTLKFSLFASGLVISMIMLIVASTNLPKEIESRVIYTVVTKPTTRLEIVLGKLLGFARVSTALLAVMGLFTWSYAGYMAHSMRQKVEAKLNDPGTSAPLRSTYEHYRDQGLLSTKYLAGPKSLEVLSRDPNRAKGWKWIYGATEQELWVPFDLTLADLIPPGQQSFDEGTFGLVLLLNDIKVQMRNLTAEEQQAITETPTSQPATAPTTGPATGPSTAPATRPMRDRGQIALNVVDELGNTLVDPKDITGPPLEMPGRPSANISAAAIIPIAARMNRLEPGKKLRLYVRLAGLSSGMEMGAGPDPVIIMVPTPNLPQNQWRVIRPAGASEESPMPAIARGRPGTFGEQIKGGPEGEGALAIYQFRQIDTPQGAKAVEFELRAGVERSGGEVTGDTDVLTTLRIIGRNSASGIESPPVEVQVESNRTVYFRMPAEVLAGGKFDILLRCITQDHWPGLRSPLQGEASLQLVTGEEPFVWNLVKSFFIIWLMSALIAAVTFLCSTFLSWPIAIVLATFLLMGQWMIQQVNLGDKGMARAVVRDLNLGDNRSGRVVTEGLEALQTTISKIGIVLPDISRFSPIEDLERGVRIPASRVGDAAEMLLIFGLPVILAAYVLLRCKEVAP